MNQKFYYLCDLKNRVALDYRQIPEVYGNITGLSDVDDATLSDLSWAGLTDRGFLTEEAANGFGMLNMPEAFALGAQAKRTFDKEVREINVSKIKVTTQAGNIFDGDEVSQGRMARAIIALQATGTPSVTWILADNTVIQASVAELGEALALAGAAQASMWVV